MLVVLCGCRSILGIDEATTAADASLVADAPMLACVQSKLLEGCFAAGTADITYASDTVISTDVACPALLIQDAREVCVVTGDNIVLEANVLFRATGTRPLLIHAKRQLLIAGTLDVAGHRETGAGASSATTCASGSGTSSGTLTGSGGGAGGSFAAAGGSGGSGPGGSGGSALTPLAATTLRGGCAGGRGGTGTSSGGLPGAGGGAVYLAAESIVVSGSINASGAAGGVAGGASDGGGGGGSGGMIAVDTPTFAVTAQASIIALGGGGSPGAFSSAGLPGTEASGPAVPAGDTLASGDAGIGGGGSTANQLGGRPGGPGTAMGGAGGGGGSSGFILLRAPMASPSIAPAAGML